ncbi:DegT/DnrJ/EryC1/StrS family aminotransferase [Planctomycetota bacterium]
MVDEKKTIQIADPSGRGTAAEFKVSYPARIIGYGQEEIDLVVDIMKNSESQTQGDYLKKFETDFAEYLGVKNAFAVTNCTNALMFSAVLAGLGKGDEVIVPAYTFCATGIAMGHTGAKIVWADMDTDSWMVDPKDVERKITPKTKAIAVVHLLGTPVDMPAIMAIAEKHNLKVIEDCAQAPGASINCKKVGSFGDFACFSFHTAKNFTTLGEGGVLVIKSDEDAKKVKGMRFCGARPFPEPRDRFWVPAMSSVDTDIEGVWPFNYCLGEAQCAVGSSMLKKLDKINDTLIAQANRIKEGLADTPEISFAKVSEGYKHIFHAFVMHFDGSAFGKDRNNLMDILVNDFKIKAIVQYYPLYRFPLFQKLGAGEHDCPVLKSWWDNSFSFPWWCGMPEETLDYMVSSLKEAIKKLKA